jgi:predicted metal-dependent RNase
MIPVFALGKTQEVMLMLHELHQEGLIPEMPLYIGGLSTKITVLYDHYASRSRRSYPGFRILEDMKMLTPRKSKKRQEIVSSPRTLYALSSGMMTEHTVSNSLPRSSSTTRATPSASSATPTPSPPATRSATPRPAT